jgi:hypothetical protein
MAIIFRPQIIPSWLDEVGGTRDSFWTTQNRIEAVPADLQLVVTKAAALTKAGSIAMTFQVPLVVGTAAASNAYNIGDAATFYLKSSGGQFGVISIPDLDPAILMGDGVTIDQTNANVVAFIAQVYAKLGDTAGNAWATVRQANRTRFPG